eukprot:1182932-Prorocentrum_minimum.AAC.6
MRPGECKFAPASANSHPGAREPAPLQVPVPAGGADDGGEVHAEHPPRRAYRGRLDRGEAARVLRQADRPRYRPLLAEGAELLARHARGGF